MKRTFLTFRSFLNSIHSSRFLHSSLVLGLFGAYFFNFSEFTEVTEFLFWYDFELTSWDSSQYKNLIVNKRLRILIFQLFDDCEVLFWRLRILSQIIQRLKVHCVPTSFRWEALNEKFLWNLKSSWSKNLKFSVSKNLSNWSEIRNA